jgi:hypothetical protein
MEIDELEAVMAFGNVLSWLWHGRDEKPLSRVKTANFPAQTRTDYIPNINFSGYRLSVIIRYLYAVCDEVY